MIVISDADEQFCKSLITASEFESKANIYDYLQLLSSLLFQHTGILRIHYLPYRISPNKRQQTQSTS